MHLSARPLRAARLSCNAPRFLICFLLTIALTTLVSFFCSLLRSGTFESLL